MAARKIFRTYRSATRVRSPNALVSESLSTSVMSFLPADAGPSNLGPRLQIQDLKLQTLVRKLAGSVLKSENSNLKSTAPCLDASFRNSPVSFLLRVQLDDELLRNGRRLHVFTLRQRSHPGFECVPVDFQPGHSVLALRDVARFEHHGVLMHFALQGNFLSYVHQVGGNVDLFTVDQHVAMQHDLPGL